MARRARTARPSLLVVAAYENGVQRADTHTGAAVIGLAADARLFVYKGHLRPEATDHELRVVGRMIVVGLAIVAITMALLIVHGSLGVFTIGNVVLGLAAIPLVLFAVYGIQDGRVYLSLSALLTEVGRYRWPQASRLIPCRASPEWTIIVPFAR